MEATIGQIDIKITGSADNAKKSVDKLSKSMSSLSGVMKAFSVGAFIKGLESIGQTIFKLGSKQSAYIETMNLFRQTMGESTEAATEFVNKAEKLLGLDSANLMKSISYLQELAEGFGLSNQEAFIMSKNLTQLAADMQSYLNIPFEQALKKVKSGLAGEIEPMRAVGVALDKASLQETARQLGIERSIDTMTRAQKTELLYYQMITKTATMQGDLARTMLSPANATKLMQTAFIRLARAIGSIFIPIMMKIIPVVIAVTEILEAAAKSIAAFFGFDLKDYSVDVSKLGTSLGGVSSGLDDVGGSAKKANKELQKMLMPFDELNNVNFDTGSSGGSGLGADIGGGGLGIDLPEYDMFEGYTSTMRDNIDAIKEKFKQWLPVLATIAGILTTIFIGKKVLDFIKYINGVKTAFEGLGLIAKGGSTVLSGLGGALAIIGKILLLVGGAVLYVWGMFDIFNEDASYTTGLLKALAGAAMIVLGIFLLFGGIPALIAAVIAAVGIIGATIYRFRDQVGKFFTETLPAWFKKVGKFIADIPKKIEYAVGFILGRIVKFFISDIPNAVKTFFTETLPSWGEAIGKFFTETLPQKFEEFKVWIKQLPEKLKELGINIITGLWNGIKTGWNKFWNYIIDLINNFVQGFKKGLGINSPSTVFYDIAINIMQGLINGIIALKDTLVQKFIEIKDNIVNKMKELKDNIIKNWEEIKSNVIDRIINLKNDISNKFVEIKNNVINKIVNLKNDMSNKFIEIKNNVIGKFEDIKNGIKNKIEGALNTVRNTINRIKDLFHFNWSLPHIKTPHLYWSSKPASGWIANVLSALNLPTSLPKLNIEWYAEGGFPEVGQLFIANEAGPELVGNIGNKTAVANQSQITEGIAEATYEAMSRALQENNGSNGTMNPQFDVYIGNEKVYSGFGKFRSQESNKYGVTI